MLVSADVKALLFFFILFFIVVSPLMMWRTIYHLIQWKKMGTQWRCFGKVLAYSDLKSHINELVVVHGQPEPLAEIFTRQLGHKRTQIIWQRSIRQELEVPRQPVWGPGKVKEKRTDFYLHFKDGGKVYVLCKPTDVQSAQSHTGGGDRVASTTRVFQKWLPVVPELTVMGRLIQKKDEFAIKPDKEFGMFFSPALPGKAAQKELAKGLGAMLGSAVCTAILIGLLTLFFE